MKYADFPVADIIVANRTRKEIGELLNLTCSIERVGLLHPVVLNAKHELIAGGRRLAAVKKLGWATIPTVIVGNLEDAILALAAERDENTCRKPWTASELAEMGRRLEELERPKAEERKRAVQFGSEDGEGNFPSPSAGQTRDIVGEALGVSGKTYEKAKAIADTAIDPLKAMVDTEQVSIDAAATVAKLSKTEQAKIVAKGPEAVKKAAKASRQAKAKDKPEPVNQPEAAATDSGTDEQETIPFIKQVEAVCREFDQIKARVEAWKEHPEAYAIHFPTIVGGIERLRQDLWSCRLSHDCPYCAKNGKPDCKGCRGTRKVTKTAHTQGERSMNKYGGAA